MTKAQRRNRGFTLIELMLVMMILAGLAGLAVFTFSGREKSAKTKMTKTQIGQIKRYLDEYKAEIGRYPSDTDGGLQALVTKPDFEEERRSEKWYKFTEASYLIDQWQNEFMYEVVDDESEGQVPHVWSTGADGDDGTEDDIKSWSENTDS